jgi:hypothetical protein
MKKILGTLALVFIASTAAAQYIPKGEPKKDISVPAYPSLVAGEYALALTIGAGGGNSQTLQGDFTRTADGVSFKAGDLVLNGTEMSGSIKLTAAYGSGSIALEGSATPAQASGTVVAKGKDGKPVANGQFTLQPHPKMVAKKKQNEPKEPDEPAWKKWICAHIPICL